MIGQKKICEGVMRINSEELRVCTESQYIIN